MNFEVRVALLPFMLGSCVLDRDYRPAQDDCVTAEGNQWCKEKHGQDLHCYRDWPSCGRTSKDGCEPEPPTDPSCYSPCGRMLSLSEVQVTCEGYDGATTSGVTTTGTASGDTTASTGDSTTSEGIMSETSEDGSESGSEGSSTSGMMDCTEHADCTDLSSPACALCAKKLETRPTPSLLKRAST